MVQQDQNLSLHHLANPGHPLGIMQGQLLMTFYCILYYTSRGTRHCPGLPIAKPDVRCYFLI